MDLFKDIKYEVQYPLFANAKDLKIDMDKVLSDLYQSRRISSIISFVLPYGLVGVPNFMLSFKGNETGSP